MTEKYEDYTDKRVLLTVDGEQREGTVEAGSAIGIVFRAKSASRTELIEASKIEAIELAPVKPRKLSSKLIAAVNTGKFREHLIDRHGYAISDIEKLTEDEAEEFHKNLDHGPLGHHHRQPSAAEEAIAAASVDEDDEDE